MQMFKAYNCQPLSIPASNQSILNLANHIIAENRTVDYIGRQPAASPATGYLKKHLAQQKEIIEKVLS